MRKRSQQITADQRNRILKQKGLLPDETNPDQPPSGLGPDAIEYANKTGVVSEEMIRDIAKKVPGVSDPEGMSLRTIRNWCKAFVDAGMKAGEVYVAIDGMSRNNPEKLRNLYRHYNIYETVN